MIDTLTTVVVQKVQASATFRFTLPPHVPMSD
jgi:hypothetical protein